MIYNITVRFSGSRDLLKTFILNKKMAFSFEKIITFLKEARIELKKVEWPNRQKTVRYTLIVIGASLTVAVFLGILDLIFTDIIQKIVY